MLPPLRQDLDDGGKENHPMKSRRLFRFPKKTKKTSTEEVVSVEISQQESPAKTTTTTTTTTPPETPSTVADDDSPLSTASNSSSSELLKPLVELPSSQNKNSKDVVFLYRPEHVPVKETCIPQEDSQDLPVVLDEVSAAASNSQSGITKENFSVTISSVLPENRSSPHSEDQVLEPVALADMFRKAADDESKSAADDCTDPATNVQEKVEAEEGKNKQLAFLGDEFVRVFQCSKEEISSILDQLPSSADGIDLDKEFGQYISATKTLASKFVGPLTTQFIDEEEENTSVDRLGSFDDEYTVASNSSKWIEFVAHLDRQREKGEAKILQKQSSVAGNEQVFYKEKVEEASDEDSQQKPSNFKSVVAEIQRLFGKARQSFQNASVKIGNTMTCTDGPEEFLICQHHEGSDARQASVGASSEWDLKLRDQSWGGNNWGDSISKLTTNPLDFTRSFSLDITEITKADSEL